MRYGFAVAIALSALPISYGAVHSYECDSHPLDDNWILLQNFCDTTEWLDGGRFLQHVEICPTAEPVSGQTATYRQFLADFEGSSSFFLEWRVETTGDRTEIPFGGPCIVSLGSFGPVWYWFGIARDQIQFFRDSNLPTPFFEIEAGVPHTFRLELYGDQQYVLFIDDQIVDTGVPEAAYPSSTPRGLMHVRAVHGESTTTWDYFRWGNIPEDGGGDFDGDGLIDQHDYFFFHDCFARRGPGFDDGPGCRFADMDCDGGVDLHDFADFQILFMDPGQAP